MFLLSPPVCMGHRGCSRGVLRAATSSLHHDVAQLHLSMDVRTIANTLSSHARLAQLPFDKILLFCELCDWLRADIAADQLSYVYTAPHTVSPPLQRFLADTLELDPDLIDTLWSSLRESIWGTDIRPPAHSTGQGLLSHFLRNGIPYGISV